MAKLDARGDPFRCEADSRTDDLAGADAFLFEYHALYKTTKTMQYFFLVFAIVDHVI